MAKDKRASWFKVYLHQRAMMEAVPDAVLGRAVKAAMVYFETGERLPLQQLESVIFCSMMPYIDEAQADYQKQVENGQKGGRPKKGRVTGGYRPLAPQTEAEAEKEAEAEAEKETEAEKEIRRENVKTAQPSSPPPHFPPDRKEIRDYCVRQGYRMDPDRFYDYYTANGWRIGQNPIRDWQAAVRNWYAKENQLGKNPDKPGWTVGNQL